MSALAPIHPLLSASVFPWLALVLGLILGSFYTACVHRYLAGMSIVRPGSHCPTCQNPLSWWENIPLVSYLVLRGRCRCRKVAIPLRYPALELLSGLWALGLAWRFGPGGEWALGMVLGGLLLVASFIDLAEYILPDALTLPGAAIALAGAVFLQDRPMADPLTGAAVGAGSFWLLQQGYRLWRGVEGLGTGDIKLMLLLGAWLGWRALPIMVMAAAALGLVAGLAAIALTKHRGEDGSVMRAAIPFGPFLAGAGMLYVLFGHYFWAWRYQ